VIYKAEHRLDLLDELRLAPDAGVVCPADPARVFGRL
jgi:hypothetical protein